MLKAHRCPTPLDNPGERRAIQIKPIRRLGRFSALRLTFQILKFGAGIFWAAKVRRRPPLEVATQCREFIENLGGLWIKAGQILSLRTDLLSREMADELSKLQFRAFGFEAAVARERIEASLGRSIESVFDVFEEQPFAAASVAQVHKGRLRREQVWVAVKVQRPDIGEIFERDLSVIAFLIHVFGRLPSVNYIGWDGMIRELHRITAEEVDYRYEAENLRRMRRLLKDHKIYVPKLFRNYSTRHVLVMEFIDGTLMSDYLRASRTDPERAAAWRAENNISAYKVGSRLLRSVYRQMFEDNLFHGDLHPGNVMLLRNSRFALIDLGSTGSLERKFLALYRYQTQAFAEGDFSKACDYYLMMADSIPAFDINKFKAESVEVFRAWEARTHMRNLTYYEKSVTGGVATEVSEIARRYRVNVSWQFLRVARALGTMDASLAVLLGTANPNKIMRKYFREMQSRTFRGLLSGGGLLTSAGGTIADLRQMATSLSDTLRQEAIKFDGIRSTAAYLFGLLFGVLRIGVLLGGLILLYDFLHQYHYELVDEVDQSIGEFDELTEILPPSYPYEYAVAGLIAVVLLFLIAGRVRRHLNRPVTRLPGGRLDT